MALLFLILISFEPLHRDSCLCASCDLQSAFAISLFCFKSFLLSYMQTAKHARITVVLSNISFLNSNTHQKITEIG